MSDEFWQARRLISAMQMVHESHPISPRPYLARTMAKYAKPKAVDKAMPSATSSPTEFRARIRGLICEWSVWLKDNDSLLE